MAIRPHHICTVTADLKLAKIWQVAIEPLGGSHTARATRKTCGSALGLTSALLILLVLLALSVLSNHASAQQPSIRPYESEEDLWEALNDGEITFDEFVELLDLSRAGADSLLVPRSDWEALPGSEAGYLISPESTQTLTHATAIAPSRVDIPWVSSIRMGVDADLNEPTGSDGYSVVRLQRGRWRGVLDFEHDRKDGGAWRRRSLIWQPRNYSIMLGNFEPRWGRGLVVGRRSRVISASQVSGSFWQPTRGRFNGAWIATDSRRRFSLQGMYSAVHGGSILESIGAVRSELRWVCNDSECHSLPAHSAMTQMRNNDWGSTGQTSWESQGQIFIFGPVAGKCLPKSRYKPMPYRQNQWNCSGHFPLAGSMLALGPMALASSVRGAADLAIATHVRQHSKSSITLSRPAPPASAASTSQLVSPRHPL